MPNAPKRPFHTAADADIKSGEVSHRQRAGTQLRARHHGDRRPAHGQARQVVGCQGSLPPPRTLRDFVLDQLRSVPLDTLRRQGLRRDF